MKISQILKIQPGITALIGGGVALLIVPVIRKALKR